MLVGEIGYNRHEFLHELKWWEVRSIIRGYNRRPRNMWSATRWETYHVMQAFCGSKALNEAGIYNPTDLIQFQWEKLPRTKVTPDDVAQLQAEMAAINAAQ